MTLSPASEKNVETIVQKIRYRFLLADGHGVGTEVGTALHPLLLRLADADGSGAVDAAEAADALAGLDVGRSAGVSANSNLPRFFV